MQRKKQPDLSRRFAPPRGGPFLGPVSDVPPKTAVKATQVTPKAQGMLGPARPQAKLEWLVDNTVWSCHLRSGQAQLAEYRLGCGFAACHAF